MADSTGMVKVGFWDEDTQSVETLWATPLGQDRYRLENSPFFAYRVSFQDVVEAQPDPGGRLEFQRVVEKSGHRTVRVILDDVESPDAKPFMDGLRQRGCGYEGFQPKLLSIDLPPEVRLEDIKRYLIEQDVQWEHADPTYADLHPDEK
ncbi:hypothetical protein COCOR_00534 [Corallococcus coralloides DSM 2259]|uniref:DUF4265 domain-containing protein n=1 Tax=Corallococcus coralloides (strain ATCC 25202 / DSM 2259 / NBRC 100086 / M2) TaxID=1144275 RepID=H8MEL0_CORCM|nr:DUF4265 domain-containing protein [Corallococcus coralloides]AFE03547.1 hypothetical protein COCOR_00534 [Corallococcus coralloides DSM 2259]